MNIPQRLFEKANKAHEKIGVKIVGGLFFISVLSILLLAATSNMIGSAVSKQI